MDQLGQPVTFKRPRRSVAGRQVSFEIRERVDRRTREAIRRSELDHLMFLVLDRVLEWTK